MINPLETGTASRQYLGVENILTRKSMLTETGGKLVKTAIIGAITGGIRAGDLSSDDRKILTKYYGLDPDASLGWRSAGRGLVGEILGRLPGNIMQNIAVQSGSPQMAAVGKAVSLAGAIIGAKKGTDKYSVSNARRLREQQRGLSVE